MEKQIFCKNCKKKIQPNEGCYMTPFGLFCIKCYDKKIKEAELITRKKILKNGKRN